MGFSIDYSISLEDGLQAYDIQDKVMEAFTSRGFSVPSIPTYTQGTRVLEYHGEVPSDLTILDDNQLGWYLSMLAEWMEYVGRQKTLADVSKNVALEKLELTEAKIRLSYKTDSSGKKLTNPERDDLVKADRRYVDAKQAYMFMEAYCALVGTVLKAAEKRHNTISRRITQRGQDIDRHNRGTNIDKTPSFVGQSFLPPRK